MTFFIVKCLVSGIIIAVVSEVAKRSPALGALVVLLPFVSLLAIIGSGETPRMSSELQILPNRRFGTFYRRFLCSWSCLRCSASEWAFGPALVQAARLRWCCTPPLHGRWQGSESTSDEKAKRP